MPEQPAPDDGMARLHAVELDLAQSKLALENQATTLNDINLQLSQIAHLLSQIPAPPNRPIPPTPPPPSPSGAPTPPTNRSSSLRASPPSDFHGDCKHGRSFLNSCLLYIRLVPEQFNNDDQKKIMWALSYMKGGRTASHANRALRHENATGLPLHSDWRSFCRFFQNTFCPTNETSHAEKVRLSLGLKCRLGRINNNTDPLLIPLKYTSNPFNNTRVGSGVVST